MMVAMECDDLADYVPPAPRIRDLDAERSDPPSGIGWEEWIKSRLKTYLRDPVIYSMCTREETATGRALSAFFTDYADIRAILAVNSLSANQRKIIAWQYGYDDLTIGEVASRLKVHHATAYRQRHAALEYIIRRYKDDPTFVLPYRTYRRDQAPSG